MNPQANPLPHPLHPHDALDPVLRQALDTASSMAREAIGRSDPNPRVGCVILSPAGQVLGRGSTQRAGSAHAEVAALQTARAAGAEVRGATAVVTIEPCSHQGRTPPCCNALIEAGIARVVVAAQDPNPRVAGQGIARLRAAGLAVTLLPPDDPAAVATRAAAASTAGRAAGSSRAAAPVRHRVSSSPSVAVPGVRVRVMRCLRRCGRAAG